MSTVTVRIPTALQLLTDGEPTINGSAEKLGELITNLDGSYPGIATKLLDEDGNLRKFINIFVNDEDIRSRDGLDTKLADGDEISVIPAIAGGIR
ncbi:MAG: MoaD/ThiS family protein [Nitrospinota bacterium]